MLSQGENSNVSFAFDVCDSLSVPNLVVDADINVWVGAFVFIGYLVVVCFSCGCCTIFEFLCTSITAAVTAFGVFPLYSSSTAIVSHILGNISSYIPSQWAVSVSCLICVTAVVRLFPTLSSSF